MCYFNLIIVKYRISNIHIKSIQKAGEFEKVIEEKPTAYCHMYSGLLKQFVD